MNKKDLVVKVADSMGVTCAEAERAVNGVLKVLTQTLRQGETVNLRDFGVFTRKVVPARRVRHPATGKEMVLPSCCVPVFRPSDKLKTTETDTTGERQQ